MVPWGGLGAWVTGSLLGSMIKLLGYLGEATLLLGDHQEITEQDMPQEGSGGQADEGADPQEGAGAGRPPHIHGRWHLQAAGWVLEACRERSKAQ